MPRNILELKKNAQTLEKVLGPLLSNVPAESKAHAEVLLTEAKSYDLNMADYLRFKIDLSDEKGKEYAQGGLDGFEAALGFLNLPLKDDYAKKITLAATNDVFQTYPGTRILFPQVVDQVLRFSTRQDQIENVASLVGNSRTINGLELIYMVASSDEEAEGTFAIAEGSEIPVRKITASEHAVKMYKHGSGYEVTYEFDRRASIDIILPYVARINRRKEISKVATATNIMINGDGAHGAAPVVYQEDFTPKGQTATANVLHYGSLLAWIVNRASKGVAIDTVVGNYNAYLQWLMLFTPTVVGNNNPDAMAASGAGPTMAKLPGLFVPINFAISSSMEDYKLIGFTKNETLEELVEAGSQISESERAVTSQKVTYVSSEVTGYRLVFGDTRSVYTFSKK